MRRIPAILLLLGIAAADAPRERFAAEPTAETLREIGRLETEEAAAFLFDVARTHETAALRDAARAAAQGMRGDDAVDVFVDRLSDRDPKARMEAIAILAKIPGADVSRELFRRARRERDPDVVRVFRDATHGRANPYLVRKYIAAARTADVAERSGAIRAIVRMGLADEVVENAVLRLLRSGWETRLLTLDAIEATRDPDLVEAAARSLRHYAWQLRVAAAQALGRFRHRDGIPALVGRLGREDRARVRHEIGKALHAITHQRFGDHAEIWERWWDEQRAVFVVPKEPPQPRERKPGERRTVAKFFGVPVEAKDVVFVVDRSASMRRASAGDTRSRLEVAKAELLGAVDELDDGARINVVFFGTKVWAWKKRLTRLGRRSRADLEAALREVGAGGGTYLYDALEMALEDPDVEAIYLLSDGEPSGGKFRRPHDILRQVRARNQIRRAAIHTVAVGLKSWLLERLARDNGGTYVQK